ncbi:hypothetical protein ACFQE5_11400 [Pseudonocardia hispaniensis]|uniref:MFS transporter n=1 Tax=Pseudonocardia hispaniensis TaxID=904933 RepID=A0ABW1J238_9PSEU
MGSPGTGVLRLVRAAAVTATLVGFAAAAHVLGGAPVPGPTLAVGSALVLVIVSALAGQRLSGPALVALLAVGQFALHHVFTLGAADHAMDRGGSPAMLAAHVLATLVSAGVLLRGERAVWAMWSWLCRLLPTVAALWLPVPARPHRRWTRRAPRPRLVLLLTAARRGPPAPGRPTPAAS